ncbi:ABC transporter permease [Paraburkholderia phenazinium]|uniref:Monosaccharide ABC transporter membrane protein, CUT2 family n=1 Tax=Paraburkholderia phenazinium TaxID=60549 RepID=A0A1N6JE87_9BURK|nr:ABC transporter permease [Paraburkholderia phenazinium]SIO42479.1 monosaccharide ABC transporter membrane protein, CUT2 family [Paraburkholderia phenazinium]
MPAITVQQTPDSQRAARRLYGFLSNQPPSWYGLGILLLVAWATRPALLSPLLLLAILKQGAILGVVTIGQSLVVRSRSIDLSISGVVVVVIWIVTSGAIPLPVPALVFLALLSGALIGTINGLIITRLRASAVVVTLAMAIVLTGSVVAASQYHQPGETPDLLRIVGSGRIGSLPIAAIVWVAVLIPFALSLRTCVFGRYLDAVGSNPTAATVSGIPSLRVMSITHIFSGLTTALAALLLVGSVSVGNTNIGQDMVLNSLAAVILGGVSFGSGKGRMLGPAVGAFMLTYLFSLLIGFGLGAAGQAMVQGAIIALAALVFTFRSR